MEEGEEAFSGDLDRGRCEATRFEEDEGVDGVN